MIRNKFVIIKDLAAVIITAALMIISVIPGYMLIGSLVIQVIVTVFFSFIVVFIADKIKIKPVILSIGLSTMIAFWVIFAVILQIRYHLSVGDYTFWWYHIFYYDKIAMLYVTWSTCTLYYIFKLILNAGTESVRKEYSKYSKIAFYSVFIFYILTFIFCFILCRVPGAVRPPVNLIPFTAFKTTFLSSRFDYELIFLFLGNIGMFIPFGIILSAMLKNKHKLIFYIIIPILLSTTIELSQYFLSIGNCDIDDVILNVLGSYIGIFVKILIDKLAYKASKGKISSVIILRTEK